MKLSSRAGRLAAVLTALAALAWPAAASASVPVTYHWTAVPVRAGGPASFEPTNVACPTSRLCVAIGPRLGFGDFSIWTLSFDPLAPPMTMRPERVLVNGVAPTSAWGFSCPAATRCAMIDGDNRVLTLTPPSRDATVGPAGVTSFIECPVTNECIGSAVDQSASPPQTEDLVTFNPLMTNIESHHYINRGPDAGGPYGPTGPRYFYGATCPSAHECLVVESRHSPSAGQPPVTAIAYDPIASGPQIDTSLFPGQEYGGAGTVCPAAGECVSLGPGLETTFDPTTSSAAPVASLGVSSGGSTLACPSVTQCVAVDTEGSGLVSFDPTHPASAIHQSAAAFHPSVNGTALTTIGCASEFECVAYTPGPSSTATAYIGIANSPGPVDLLTVGRTSARGTRVSTAIACARVAPAACPVTLSVTIALPHHRSRLVGQASRRVRAGRSATLTVVLNRAGQDALRSAGKLRATLRVTQSGRVRASRAVVFSTSR